MRWNGCRHRSTVDVPWSCDELRLALTKGGDADDERSGRNDLKAVESRAVQKYVQAINEDAETALSEHKANLGEMDDYPNKYLSEYKSDAKALDKAWGDFNAEWNKIVFKKATEKALGEGIAAARKYKSAESRRLALLKELGDLK